MTVHVRLDVLLILAAALHSACGATAASEEVGAVVSNIPYYVADYPESTPYREERCKLDVYSSDQTARLPVVVWFHGGGLTGGSKYLPRELKGTSVVAVAANYRLSPAVEGAQCIADAAAAVSWTFHNIGRYGGDTNLIFVAGHSAGAYLTLMVGLDKHWLARHGVDADAIAGLIPLSGQAITHFTIRKDHGVNSKQAVIDEWAPISHARSNAPPMLLITGDRTKDMATRYAENAYLLEMMKLNGHTNTTLFELQGYGHGVERPGMPLLMEFVKTTASNKLAAMSAASP